MVKNTPPHLPHTERLARLTATATEGGARAVVAEVAAMSEEDAKSALIVAVGYLGVAARAGAKRR